MGMLEVELCLGDLTMMILKLAFIAGSSKHGNAVRAADDSKWVVAMYLGKINTVNNNKLRRIRNM